VKFPARYSCTYVLARSFYATLYLAVLLQQRIKTSSRFWFVYFTCVKFVFARIVSLRMMYRGLGFICCHYSSNLTILNAISAVVGAEMKILSDAQVCTFLHLTGFKCRKAQTQQCSIFRYLGIS